MNITCSLKWEVAFVGITLLGVTDLIQENILGAGYTLVDGSHLGS